MAFEITNVLYVLSWQSSATQEMINYKDNPVEWAMMISELDEAKGHLGSLSVLLAQSEKIDEAEFAVQLGHVYAHLNRVWNSRDMKGDIPEDVWERLSAFPDDIDPIG